MNRLLWMCCLFYFVIGMTSVFLGGMIPELLPYYGRAYTDGGMLLFTQFFGFLSGVVVTPVLSRPLGRKRLLVMALVMISIAYSCLGFLPAWWLVVAFTFCAGFGSGLIESTVGALVIEFVEEKKAIAMSRLDVFFGAGALLMPATVGLFIWLEVWRAAFFVLSGFTVVMLILWLSLSFAEAEGLLRRRTVLSHEEPKQPIGRKNWRYLALFIPFFFVYQGLEISIMNFLPSIMIESMSVDAATASLSVTVYWTSMVVGRVFAGIVAERITYMPFLLWSCFGTLVTLIGLASLDGKITTFVLICLLGLLMSGLFSIALILANVIIPGITEKLTSTLIAAAGIGGAALSLATGWSMANLSVGTTMWLLVAFQVVLCATIVLTAVTRSNQTNVSLRAE